MLIITVSIFIGLFLLMVVFYQNQSVNKAKKMLKQAQEKSIQLENKVQLSRDELKKNKEFLDRKKQEIEDLRDLNKKKMKRFQELRNNKNNQQEAIMNDQILDEDKKTILALEQTLERTKTELQQEKANIEEALKKEKEEEVSRLKEDNNNLREEIKKQKRLIRPQGNKIDLSSLSDETASEFARLLRKAENHEKLYGISRAKLHLAQEKFTALQKRYFEVCRELALSMGNEGMTDDPTKARDFAEEIVSKKHHDEDSRVSVVVNNDSLSSPQEEVASTESANEPSEEKHS